METRPSNKKMTDSEQEQNLVSDNSDIQEEISELKTYIANGICQVIQNYKKVYKNKPKRIRNFIEKLKNASKSNPSFYDLSPILENEVFNEDLFKKTMDKHSLGAAVDILKVINKIKPKRIPDEFKLLLGIPIKHKSIKQTFTWFKNSFKKNDTYLNDSSQEADVSTKTKGLTPESLKKLLEEEKEIERIKQKKKDIPTNKSPKNDSPIAVAIEQNPKPLKSESTSSSDEETKPEKKVKQVLTGLIKKEKKKDILPKKKTHKIEPAKKEPTLSIEQNTKPIELEKPIEQQQPVTSEPTVAKDEQKETQLKLEDEKGTIESQKDEKSNEVKQPMEMPPQEQQPTVSLANQGAGNSDAGNSTKELKAEEMSAPSKNTTPDFAKSIQNILDNDFYYKSETPNHTQEYARDAFQNNLKQLEKFLNILNNLQNGSRIASSSAKFITQYQDISDEFITKYQNIIISAYQAEIINLTTLIKLNRLAAEIALGEPQKNSISVSKLNDTIKHYETSRGFFRRLFGNTQTIKDLKLLREINETTTPNTPIYKKEIELILKLRDKRPSLIRSGSQQKSISLFQNGKKRNKKLSSTEETIERLAKSFGLRPEESFGLKKVVKKSSFSR